MVITTIVRIIGIIISFMLINIIIKKSNIKNKRKMSIFLGVYFIILYLKCSIFEIIRLFLLIILFTLIYFKIKKSKIKNKKKVYIITVVYCILLYIISGIFIIENLFIDFKSPQKAYNYLFGNTKNVEIIKSDNSAFTINKKDEVNIINKKNGKWILPNPFNIKIVSYDIFNEKKYRATIYISKTGDYYIGIKGFNKKIEISDNQNSSFIETKRRNINGNYYNYYAYIKEFNRDYRLIINGEEVDLKQ